MNTQRFTWGDAARQGALTGAVLAYIYSLVFLLYAVVRESISVLNVGAADGGVLLLSNAVSLAMVVLIFGTVMAIVSAVIGAVTEVVLLYAIRRLIGDYQPMAAVLTGVGVALVLAFVIHLITGIAPSPRLNLAYPETYLFWLGVPTVVYVVAGALRGGEINTRMA
jgi:hypothetical protein